MTAFISLLARMAGTGALLWWYWTGSRLAAVIMFALLVLAVELLSFTTGIARRRP